jgi:hypothetical protein
MPTWLHSSGWKLRALPIWKIGRPLAAPILLRLALHRWRIRIFDFQPKRRAARAIDRAEPLRHDALTTEFAGVLKDDLAVLLEMLVE